ncbi:NUDIX domain-containing protein [Nonomuraea sp. NPDC049400]|uniref:NUDIX domain-containing protein n=1 Tax=Nonomuraea sp. NPDC049400 TaxID=3364352 RepID=UPI0037952789
MGLDLSLVPDLVKPMALPLTGGAFPEAFVGGVIDEAQALENVADFLAKLNTDDASAIVRLLRGHEWQGAAKEAFEQVFAALGGQPEGDDPHSEGTLLDLLERALRDEAKSLREHGVRMQHTEWMIYASLALLGAVIVKLLVWIYVNGPAVLRLIQHNTLLTQVNIQTMKRLVLVSMLKFAGIMGGLDFGVQVAQQIWGDREEGDFDLASLAMSLGSGALTGALFAGANVGLSRLLSREMVYVASEAELAVRDKIVAIGQSMYGQALLGGVAGTAGAVPGLALSGQLDASHLAYTFIAGVAGGLDVPASARVSYIPIRAVAEIGDTPSTKIPHADTDPPRQPPPSLTAAPHDPSGAQPPPPPSGVPHDAPGEQPPPPPSAVPHDPSGGDMLPAAGHDTAALAFHLRPERHADVDTLINRQPSEPGANPLQPHSDRVIVGEVIRRHDTLLDGPAGDGAEQGGAPVRPPQNLPAERTPSGETAPAAPRTQAVVPGDLPRGSLLPATVPAIVTAPPDDAGTPEHNAAQASRHGQENADPKTAETRPATPDAADPASTGQSRPERPQQSHADDSALPASHPPREHSTPPVSDPQTSTLSRIPQDRTGPALEPAPGPVAGTAAARPVTGHGDRPAEAMPAAPAPIADAAASARPHSSERGERPAEGPGSGATADTPRTGLQGDASVPVARSSALPENPRGLEPVVRRVADLLSRDGQHDPISAAGWQAAHAATVKMLMDTMLSPTKDMLGVGRKRNLRQALGNPEYDLVLSELPFMGRTIRTWQAVERSSIASFVEGSRKYADVPRRIIRQIPFDSPEAHDIVRRLAAEELLRTWGYGASEMLPERLAMHMAAREEFGLTGVLDLEAYGDPNRNMTARDVHARSGDMLRDFLRQQYAQTQRELESRGIDELVLYRGIAFDPRHPVPSLADAADGDVVQAPPALPLQSWSAIPGVAKRYTGLGDGAVMAGVFPASQVLSTPWTGMGQLPLNEFVVLATPGEVTVLRPPHIVVTGPGMSGAHPTLPPGWQVRRSTDAWTQCEQGHRHWGTEGGAGLLLFHRLPDGEVRVLMQLRSMETHHGGTWGPPGGARHSGEGPIDAGLREPREENRLNTDEVNVRGVHHDDHGGWTFDTVIGEMPYLADVWPASRESLDNAWVPLEEVSRLNLHPDFARAWPEVRAELERILADSDTGSRPPAPPAPPTSPAATHQVPAPPNTATGLSSVADARPRNFAEAAAIFYRWTPDNGNTPDPNRRDASGSPPPAVPDAELLAEGRRLSAQLRVLDPGETTTRALALMARTIGGANPSGEISEVAAALGLPHDIDALVEVFNDARRYGMSPDSATDRAALTDILRRSMEVDPYRWTGHRYQTLVGLLAANVRQARAVGLMVKMMGDTVTYKKARDLVRPVLQRYGISDVQQLLPVIHAAHQNGYFPSGATGEPAFRAGLDEFWRQDAHLWAGVLLAEQLSLPDLRDSTARLVARLYEIVTGLALDRFRTGEPLEYLAGDVGQGRSVEQFVRLAEEAQAHGADLARAPSRQEIVDRLIAYRARDPHLWDGLRVAAERDVMRPSDDEARALSRLAEITSSEAPSSLWVFDPLRRLAGEAGLDHSVERLAQRAVEVQRDGFDLFGPVDRRQVLDALTQHAGRPVTGRQPDTPHVPPGLHDLAPSIVRDARQAAIQEHATARQAYRQAHPPLRRSLSRLAGPDPLAVAEQQRVASLEARVHAWQRWPEVPEVSYVKDFAAFRRAYDQAVERAARGEAVIPYMRKNATASLAARDGGRGFGLELEFDLPIGDARPRAMQAIARDLYRAGLTSDPQVHDYHTMQAQGYRSGRNGGRGLWRLEQDGSVAGELVSPILYDEPATWENLQLACEIIQAYGGTASASTGGHIHVSTYDYDHIVENYTSVVDYVDHHSDTFFRLGHNPERESHRGLKYCRPNRRPAAGYKSIAPVRDHNSRGSADHGFAVNLESITGSPEDHIEFRLYDGSLYAPLIQSQVKVSVAAVDAAFRNVTLGQPPNRGQRDLLGTHAELLKLDPAFDLTERGSLSFRCLMDELFWRAADKEQVTAVYAATRWLLTA